MAVGGAAVGRPDGLDASEWLGVMLGLGGGVGLSMGVALGLATVAVALGLPMRSDDAIDGAGDDSVAAALEAAAAPAGDSDPTLLPSR